MRIKAVTKAYYVNRLRFKGVGQTNFDGYLMLEKEQLQLHFHEFKALDPKENYGQVYIRTDAINTLYQSLLDTNTPIHLNGHLQTKPGAKGMCSTRSRQ